MCHFVILAYFAVECLCAMTESMHFHMKPVTHFLLYNACTLYGVWRTVRGIKSTQYNFFTHCITKGLNSSISQRKPKLISHQGAATAACKSTRFAAVLTMTCQGSHKNTDTWEGLVWKSLLIDGIIITYKDLKIEQLLLLWSGKWFTLISYSINKPAVSAENN